MSPGRIIVVLFRTKYAVPRQIEPGILKLTIRRGQSNFSIVFIFVSFEEKGYYRVVSEVQLSFDCRSYCRRSRRMQGSSTIVLFPNYLGQDIIKIPRFRVRVRVELPVPVLGCTGNQSNVSPVPELSFLPAPYRG